MGHWQGSDKLGRLKCWADCTVRSLESGAMTIELRAATTGDQELITRALYAAWQWRHPWDEALFRDHLVAGSPDSYVDDFGLREGDAGVIAEERTATSMEFAGAAWYRFFPATQQRAGFVAEDVPELVIAVEARARRRGVGRRLLEELVELAATLGIDALSLHVSNENTSAAALYRSLGFAAIRDYEGRGTVMVKELKP